MIKDTGDRRIFDTGFQRDMAQGKGRMDLCPWFAIMELACHCEEGALKYGERNIDKGSPLHTLIDSGLRHVARFIEGVDDGEDHLRAACWNFMWALQQRFTHPECNDLPWAQFQNEFKFLEDSPFVMEMAAAVARAERTGSNETDSSEESIAWSVEGPLSDSASGVAVASSEGEPAFPSVGE